MAAHKTIFPSATPFLPGRWTLEKLRDSSRSCQGCDLYLRATQTVFGEGARNARIMLVGEQPGDKEDVDGLPFMGPAGRVLDDGLAAAGIDRSEVYLTNAVKHFRWVPDPRGKRRIHKKPRASEVLACRPWLDAEIEVIKPQVIVCLGATAAQALLGKDFSVLRQRGMLVASNLARFVMATVHPSSILRARDNRRDQMEAFIRDLTVAARQVQSLGKSA